MHSPGLRYRLHCHVSVSAEIGNDIICGKQRQGFCLTVCHIPLTTKTVHYRMMSKHKRYQLTRRQQFCFQQIPLLFWHCPMCICLFSRCNANEFIWPEFKSKSDVPKHRLIIIPRSQRLIVIPRDIVDGHCQGSHQTRVKLVVFDEWILAYVACYDDKIGTQCLDHLKGGLRLP